MSRRRISLAVLLLGLAALAAIALWHAARAGPVSQQERARQIATALRCPTCQGESVADSNAGVALGMRAEIRDQLGQGRTPAQIRDWFVARYGDWILLAPPRRDGGWLIWLAPAAAVAVGALLAWRFVRRRPSVTATDVRAARQALDAYRRGALGLDCSPSAEHFKDALVALDQRDPADGPAVRRHALATAAHASRAYAARDTPARSTAPSGGVRHRTIWLALTVTFLATCTALLAVSLHDRPAGAPVTGNAQRPGAAPTGATLPSLTTLSARAKKNPRDVAAWLALAHGYDRRGNLAKAYSAYRKAAELAPSNRDARLGLASILIRGGSPGEALPIAERLVQENPTDPKALLTLGLAQRASVHSDISRKTLEKFLSIAPDDPAAPHVRQLLRAHR